MCLSLIQSWAWPTLNNLADCLTLLEKPCLIMKFSKNFFFLRWGKICNAAAYAFGGFLSYFLFSRIGMDMTNPYTATRALVASRQAELDSSSDLLLLIKIYPNGLLTPHLGMLKAGETVFVCLPFEMKLVLFACLKLKRINFGASLLFESSTDMAFGVVFIKQPLWFFCLFVYLNVSPHCSRKWKSLGVVSTRAQ